VPQRFEQNSSNLSKVETMVTFPTELDMRPYMHDAINGYVLLISPRRTTDALAFRQEGVLPREMYRYQLSTVVTHEGKLDNGHYWANVRSGCEWFQCDDEKGSCFPIHCLSKWADDEFGSDLDVTCAGVGSEGVYALLRQDLDRVWVWLDGWVVLCGSGRGYDSQISSSCHAKDAPDLIRRRAACISPPMAKRASVANFTVTPAGTDQLFESAKNGQPPQTMLQ
jgi:hypothetical protein